MIWSAFTGQPNISRVLISKPSVSAKYQLSTLFPDSTAATCPEINGIADHIEAFLGGDDIQFSLEMEGVLFNDKGRVITGGLFY